MREKIGTGNSEVATISLYLVYMFEFHWNENRFRVIFINVGFMLICYQLCYKYDYFKFHEFVN